MTIKHIITPRQKNLGDFSVRRLLPYAKQRMVGPWIFFDHMGPTDFPAGKGIDVRPHPHINLATVTYLFEGEIFHRDSLGNAQAIQAGDINLMVAGRGITHSERERDAIRNSDHRIHGLQLWHALPEEYEEIEPDFYHYPADNLPHFSKEGVPVRVMIGNAYGFTSPVKTFAETLYVEAKMMANDRLPLPVAEQIAIYVAAGSIVIGESTIEQYSMAIMEDGITSNILANNDAQIAIIGGKKMSERFIEWNFISSHKERIEQAKDDWKERRFPIIPGDEEEFIPLPE